MSLLRIAGLHKAYAGLPVLQGLDLEIGSGEFCGLVGANGSGKSTLMRCIAGIDRADRGHVEIDGRSLSDDPVLAKAGLGYAVDVNTLPTELSGRQCMALVGRVRGLPDADAGSQALADALNLTPWLDRRVQVYSLGTRQKLSIVLALMGSPRLILLDESLNGLDPVAAYTLKQHLRQQVRQRGCSVLLATHAVDSLDFWDRALLLDGSIVRQWNTADGALSAAALEQQIVAALIARGSR